MGLNQDEEKSLKRNRSPSPGPAKQILLLG